MYPTQNSQLKAWQLVQFVLRCQQACMQVAAPAVYDGHTLTYAPDSIQYNCQRSVELHRKLFCNSMEISLNKMVDEVTLQCAVCC